MKVSRKDYIIEISKKYSVTSKFTSFVAIEKRDKGETFDSTSALNVDEILDGESVDILGYIDWLEDSEDETEVGLYVTTLHYLSVSVYHFCLLCFSPSWMNRYYTITGCSPVDVEDPKYLRFYRPYPRKREFLTTH